MQTFEFKTKVPRKHALVRGYVVSLVTLLGVGIGFELSDPRTPLWVLSFGLLGATSLTVRLPRNSHPPRKVAPFVGTTVGVAAAWFLIAGQSLAAAAQTTIQPLSRVLIEAISPQVAEALHRREFALGVPIADADVPRAVADPAFAPVLRAVAREFCARPSSARILACMSPQAQARAIERLTVVAPPRPPTP